MCCSGQVRRVKWQLSISPLALLLNHVWQTHEFIKMVWWILPWEHLYKALTDTDSYGNNRKLLQSGVNEEMLYIIHRWVHMPRWNAASIQITTCDFWHTLVQYMLPKFCWTNNYSIFFLKASIFHKYPRCLNESFLIKIKEKMCRSSKIPTICWIRPH